MGEIGSLLSANAGLLVVMALLLGLLVGSFLNVVIHRLPVMLERGWQRECDRYLGRDMQEAARYNLLVPASHCPECKQAVQAWQNIPLLSYALLRGRCAHCGTGISWRYPAVELLTGLLFAVVAWRFGWGAPMLGYLLLTAVLVALTFIDADTQLLPDDLTLPLVWGGLLFNLYTGAVALEDAVIGAVAGYLSLWLVYWLFKLCTGKEGMGYGDFKLLAAFGAWLGWSMLPLIILLSSLVGAVVGIVLMMLSRIGRGQALPFGPYLAAAGWIALLWGKQIVSWYLGSYVH
ncbi:A24 family peptidase [Aquitalea sp. LB_tupeE]|uniref:prepilin peptidase n=1 Tax=Aquitalea sp. LB_tupeE TaxID=2748078 RepID=UPI0015BAA362|nr:A24 family peptidase [Aquitalea sp. LB_tupeE]NWK77155.1 prepilin peptidase [Aquitalea sp. LB_tupeE]